MTRDDLIGRLKRQRSLFEREQVTSVALFGSRAHAADRPDSDVDLLVDYAPNARISLFDVSRLERLLSETLALPVQIVTGPISKDRLRRNIAADRIDVF
ncbi:nucleotidyltransferase [soil metagenome]